MDLYTKMQFSLGQTNIPTFCHKYLQITLAQRKKFQFLSVHWVVRSLAVICFSGLQEICSKIGNRSDFHRR